MIEFGVMSSDQGDLLFEYIYTLPDMNEKGVKKVGLDTIFHLEGLTKVLPGLGLLEIKDEGLIRSGDFITKYMPELRTLRGQSREDDLIWAVAWDDVTLGALAPYKAGTPSDCE